jgi:hypothetical protein
LTVSVLTLLDCEVLLAGFLLSATTGFFVVRVEGSSLPFFEALIGATLVAAFFLDRDSAFAEAIALEESAFSWVACVVDFFLAKGNALVGSSVLLLQKDGWQCTVLHYQNVMTR